jgi:predicted alpha/beta hydrolase
MSIRDLKRHIKETNDSENQPTLDLFDNLIAALDAPITEQPTEDNQPNEAASQNSDNQSTEQAT